MASTLGKRHLQPTFTRHTSDGVLNLSAVYGRLSLQQSAIYHDDGGSSKLDEIAKRVGPERLEGEHRYIAASIIFGANEKSFEAKTTPAIKQIVYSGEDIKYSKSLDALNTDRGENTPEAKKIENVELFLEDISERKDNFNKNIESQKNQIGSLKSDPALDERLDIRSSGIELRENQLERYQWQLKNILSVKIDPPIPGLDVDGLAKKYGIAVTQNDPASPNTTLKSKFENKAAADTKPTDIKEIKFSLTNATAKDVSKILEGILAESHGEQDLLRVTLTGDMADKENMSKQVVNLAASLKQNYSGSGTLEIIIPPLYKIEGMGFKEKNVIPLQGIRHVQSDIAIETPATPSGTAPAPTHAIAPNN